MPTEKQFAANRANAQKSTGPTSPAGKAASSRNAYRTGLYAETLLARQEDPELLAPLGREYYHHYQPATPVERELVDTLIRTVHLTRRVTRAETSLWNRIWEKTPERISPDAEHGAAAEIGGLEFGRIQRRLNQLDCTYKETWQTLELLQGRRKAAEANSQPAPEDETRDPQHLDPEPTSPKIGFVPSTPSAQPSTPAPTEIPPSLPPRFSPCLRASAVNPHPPTPETPNGTPPATQALES